MWPCLSRSVPFGLDEDVSISNWGMYKLSGNSLVLKKKKKFNRSETCPQCRNPCAKNQIKRIYIDFVCDEELAIAQTLKEIKKPTKLDTDAEEMIKILLEHIDNGPNGGQPKQQETPNEECDLCIAFQEAYDKILVEKDQIVQILNNIERENQNLIYCNQQTSKDIDKLEMQIQANEVYRQQIEIQLETAQKLIARIQCENSSNQRTINDLKSTISKNESELNGLRGQFHNLSEQMREMSSYYDAELQQIYHGIQCLFDGNQQRKFLKRYRQSSLQNYQTAENDTTNPNTNLCRKIVPYCGDIDCWEYIMVPILKRS